MPQVHCDTTWPFWPARCLFAAVFARRTDDIAINSHQMDAIVIWRVHTAAPSSVSFVHATRTVWPFRVVTQVVMVVPELVALAVK